MPSLPTSVAIGRSSYFLRALVATLCHLTTLWRHPSVIQGAFELDNHESLPAGSISESLGRHASIRVLPDDILLVIFGFYRVSSPLRWHRLAHVCQRWRRTVFSSPRSLDLRLYCTPTTPVRSTLDCWPGLPIEVECHTRLSPKEEDNVIAVLQHHNRVRSIKLHNLTESFREKLYTQVKEPFSELEDFVLRSSETPFLPQPETNPFRLSSRLRVLHLDNINLPSFPLDPSSSQNLVDLRLHNISLTLPGFPLPAPERRVVLPALTRLDFHGFISDFDCLVARIDAPCLEKIKIAFIYLHRGHIDQSQLGQFINRIDSQRSYSRAEIRMSVDHISIRFTMSGLESPLHFELHILYCDLFEQLSFITCICDLLLPFLLGTRDLGIITSPLSSSQDDGKWLRLLRLFGNVQRFYVAGDCATYIMYDLLQAERKFATVLPALRNLYLVINPEARMLLAQLWPEVESFNTLRKVSGRPVRVVYCPSLAYAKALLDANLEDDTRSPLS